MVFFLCVLDIPFVRPRYTSLQSMAIRFVFVNAIKCGLLVHQSWVLQNLPLKFCWPEKKRRVKKNHWMTFEQVPRNYKNKRYTELSGELVFGCLHFIPAPRNYLFVRANSPHPRQKPALSNPEIWLHKALSQG